MNQCCETYCLICQKPQIAPYPYAICNECGKDFYDAEKSTAVDFIAKQQTRIMEQETYIIWANTRISELEEAIALRQE